MQDKPQKVSSGVGSMLEGVRTGFDLIKLLARVGLGYPREHVPWGWKGPKGPAWCVLYQAQAHGAQNKRLYVPPSSPG